VSVRVHTFTAEQWLPRRVGQVFDFFSDAGNLGVLTPPWLHFRILTPRPIPMRPGTLIDYRLRVRGVPIFWRSEITEWDPPFRFADRQVRGPYRRWVHTHSFEGRDGGTLMSDKVEFAVPGWFLEPLLTRWLVLPDVERIFAYRREKMRELFGESHKNDTGRIAD
jgi:ligand-binding SRPBCC domain-containing protein